MILSTWLDPLAARCPQPIELRYSVAELQDHNKNSFTQGLVFADGHLVESTGLYGQSKLIVHKPGSSLAVDLPKNRFGEGLAWFDQKLWQLSWKAGELRSYNLELELQNIQRYQGEGWGLTHDSNQFIMSDGSAYLSLRDNNFAETKRVLVLDGNKPLKHINELEWVEGQLFANIWQQERLARIDTHSGCVSGWLELADLWPRMIRPPTADVLNGIAWDAKNRELWVTGKNWPRLYRLKIDALSPATP